MSAADVSAAGRVGVGTPSSGTPSMGVRPSGGLPTGPTGLPSGAGLPSYGSRSGTPGSRIDGPFRAERQPTGDQWRDWREVDARAAQQQQNAYAGQMEAQQQQAMQMQQQQQQQQRGPQLNSGLRDPSPNPAYLLQQHASSPPPTHPSAMADGNAPALAAPRAVPPYPRFQSPHPVDGIARSPSPSKRGGASNFGFGDARERWASISQAQQQSQQGPPAGPQQSQQQQYQPPQQRQALPPLQQGPPPPHAQQQAPPPQQQQLQQQAQAQQQQRSAGAGADPFANYADIWSGQSGRQSLDGQRPAQPQSAQQQQQLPPQQQQHSQPQPSQQQPAPHQLLQQQQQQHGAPDGVPPPSAGGQRAYQTSSSHPDLEQLSTRFDGPSSAYPGSARDEGPYSGIPNGSGSVSRDEQARILYSLQQQNLSGVPASGSLSPRSLLHYHHHQVQAQQQASLALQQAQQGQLGQSSITMIGGSPEEITTVFIVGFPDDMTEREFANMFLFAKGFEASTLKIPSGGTAPNGPLGRPENGPLSGPGGPYNAVNMSGSGLFDLAGSGPPGGWDEHSLSLALSRAGAGDAFSSLANLGGLSSALQGLGGPHAQGATGPGGKIKQIIGFAKFRTRAEALEARDALNGRKIDAERGCVLKTEMAKKNLHTKQRPVLSNINPLDGSPFGPPSAGGPLQHGVPGASGQFPPPGGPAGLNLNERDLAFQRTRLEPQSATSVAPPSAGGYGSFNPNNAPFDPFPQAPNGPPSNANGLLSPSHEGYARNSSDFFGAPTGPRSQMQGAPSRSAFVEGSQGSDAARVPVSANSAANADKWAPMGPLDYFGPCQAPSSRFDGVGQQTQQQAPSQQQQQQPQHQQQLQQSQHGQHPSQHQLQQQQQQQQHGHQLDGSQSRLEQQQLRGPDWSTLGSPPGLYGQARANPLGFGGLQAPKGPGGSSPFGDHDGNSAGSGESGHGAHRNSAGQEDFGRGESTAQVLSISPPRTGSEVTRMMQGLDEAVSIPSSSLRLRTQQAQQVGKSSLAAALSARFGDLRLDSPSSAALPASSSDDHDSFALSSAHPPPPASSASFSPTSSLPPRPRSRHDSIVSAHSASTRNPSSPTSPLSSDLPSPTSRSFSIDANPPGNTLFVGNLPSSSSSGANAVHLEEQLRAMFSAKPGFRQISFRVKANGPMCFVEFDDVQRAAQCLAEVNGDTLGGAVKNGGLRMSFSKNPLFRSTLPGAGGVSAGPGSSGSGSPTSPKLGYGQLSLAQASQSLLSTTRTIELDLDSLNNLEEKSYADGFANGHAHGELHGTFEGRDLGRLKGFEVWEEVGFYEGMTRFWLSTIRAQAPDEATRSRKQQKQLQHLLALESLIAFFPMVNTSTPDADLAATASASQQADETAEDEIDPSKMDMLALLERIRARYKLTCSALGVRPRLRAAGAGDATPLAVSGSLDDDDDLGEAPARTAMVHGRTIDPDQLNF